MDKFLAEMAEILEEDQVDAADLLDSFSSWDSLAVLSVIAMADAEFGISMSSNEVNQAETVQALYASMVAKQARA